ncbi:MAG: M48 family metalloprotease [Thermodesulfobacteriota bacterium]
MKLFRITPLSAIFLFTAIIMLCRPASAMTVKEEEEMSHEFMRMAVSHYQLIEDPMINDYVKRVGRKIIAVMPPQPFTFHFYVVQEDVYNAFAGPAGHIFLHSGLLEALSGEDELAGILAHEISHVSCRHLSDMIKKSKQTTLATLAGVAAGIFLGAGGAAAAGSAVTIGSMAAGQSLSLAYSRENEIQADQNALQYLAKAGYSASGLLESLKTIRAKTWFGTDEVPSYLMTHPAVDDRITYIGSWVTAHETGPHQPSDQSRNDFSRMKTRLLARYGDKQAVLNKFAEDSRKHPESAMIQYGYGLALARNGQHKEAIAHLRNALEKKPFDPYIVQELGRIYFLEGQYEKALAMLGTNSPSQPFDPESRVYLGRTQAALSLYSEAIATLEEVTAQKPDYVMTYYYLGEIHGKEGRLGNAHYYLGIYYRKKEDYLNADFHLKTAVKQLTDPALIREAEKLLNEVRQMEAMGMTGMF